MPLILVIDLGGTKIAAGLVDSHQCRLFNKKVKLIQKNISRGQLANLIKKISRQILDESQLEKNSLSAIGIAAPGPLDSKRGIIFYAPNLPKIKNFKIVQVLRKEFHKPVFLENDAKAAALGEWKHGAGQGTKNMIYLTISTGIGGGIIIDSKLYKGRGQAGEIGHMVIDLNGPKCGCGRRGCLEATASGTAMAKRAKEVYKNRKFKDLEKIDSKWVFRKIRQGDKIAQKIFRENIEALATGLTNLIYIFQPEIIILGGGMMKDKDIILPKLRKSVKEKLMYGFSGTKIMAAKLGDKSGLVGLAVLAKMIF